MPQPAKNFRIGRIHVQPAERSAMVRTGPRTAAPSRFRAFVSMKTPDLDVILDLALETGAVPVIEQLAIRPGKKNPVTSAALRGILLDQIIPAVVKAASKRVIERGDVHPGAFQLESERDSNGVRVGVPPGTDEKVLQAARAYRDALAAGSRSPALAVMEDMDLSRAQAARYIRKARTAGLLPAVDDVIKGRVPRPALPAQDDHAHSRPPIQLRNMNDPATWLPPGGEDEG